MLENRFWKWAVSIIDLCLYLVVGLGISDMEASGPVTSNITWRMFSFVGLYITNQVTLWSTFPLQKLIVPHLVTKYPAFCRTQKFISSSTRFRDIILVQNQMKVVHTIYLFGISCNIIMPYV